MPELQQEAQRRSRHVGGIFAPPLCDKTLEVYKEIIDGLSDGPVKQALQVLWNCASQWWNLPESVGEGRAHPIGHGFIVDLDDETKAALEPHIPWGYELLALSNSDATGLFDSIDGTEHKDVRDMAFHLLWYAKELELDREPYTSDKYFASAPEHVKERMRLTPPSLQADKSSLPITIRHLND